MIKTEQEAKSQWCPLARVIVIDATGAAATPPFNRTVSREPSRVKTAQPTNEVTVSLPEACLCAGPSCMMWRWFDVEGFEEARRGFCGLAMNPVAFQ